MKVWIHSECSLKMNNIISKTALMYSIFNPFPYFSSSSLFSFSIWIAGFNLKIVYVHYRIRQKGIEDFADGKEIFGALSIWEACGIGILVEFSAKTISKIEVLLPLKLSFQNQCFIDINMGSTYSVTISQPLNSQFHVNYFCGRSAYTLADCCT